MSNRPRKSFLQKYYGIFVALFVALLVWTFYGSTVKDFWLGFAYTPSSEEAEIRSELELTSRGERIFNAANVQLESSEEFNRHCQSRSREFSLLGCYADGTIYVYEITNEQLVAANKVTAAHELLHAVWERMNIWEQIRVEELLEEVYQQNKTWFDEELEYYDEDDWIEEVWTRAGTKLADLPEELEQYYAKIFRNRAKIVQFYQEYEAPFLALQLELEELADEIEKTSMELETEREEYYNQAEALHKEIMQFNDCAGTTGCFTSDSEFSRRRNAILNSQKQLEVERERLNQKITENNQRIATYRQRQTELGDLNDAMNSNIEIMEVLKENN